MKMNSPQKTARVAAFVFLIIFFLGMSTELFIRPGMIVPGDAAATVKNIAASEALFRLSLVSDLIRQMFLMLLPLVLYKLLKPVNKNIASLMVIFALVCVPISMLNELNHFRCPAAIERCWLFNSIQSRSIECSGDVLSRVAQIWNIYPPGSFPLGTSPWLFGFQVGFPSQNSGHLVDAWRFMLYGTGCFILSFSQLRFDDFWLVCVYWRVVILLVAFD